MATETVSYKIQIDADTKSLADLEKEIKDLNKETIELKETNSLFKKELIALEQQYERIPKTALSARKKIGTQIDELKVAIKENNQALGEFRIKKAQKKQMISDLKEVHNEVGHSVEAFAGFGAAVGEATAGFMLLSGASEESQEKLHHAIGTVMAFEGAAKGVIHAQELYNKTIKGNNILLAINNKATKMASVVQKLFTGSVNTTSTAFKGLKGAIIATGIGALVVAVGLLIANFDKLKEAVNGVSKEQKKLLEDQQEELKIAQKKLSLIDQQSNLLKLQGKSEKEILELKKEATEEAISAQIKILEATIEQEKAQIKAAARNKMILAGIIRVITMPLTVLLETVDAITLGLEKIGAIEKSTTLVKDFTTKAAGFIFDPMETAKEGAETIEETTKVLNELRDQRAGHILALQDMDEEHNEKTEEQEEKSFKKRLMRNQQLMDAYLKQTEERLRKEWDIYLQSIEDFAEKRQELFDSIGEEEDELILEDIEVQTEKGRMLQELKAQQIKDEIEQERQLRAMEAQFDFEDTIERLTVNGQLTNDLRIALEQDLQQTLTEIDKNAAKERFDNDMALQQAKLQMASQGIGAIIKLNTAFAKDNEKSQKKAFETNKKLQIAQAIIATYQGATSAYASASANAISIYFPAYPALMAAIAVAGGLANVATISKTQFQSSSTGGGSGYGSGGAPSFGGGDISPPSLGPTNTSTLIPQDEEGNSMQVFVTETDITDTQNKVNVIETQATI